VNILAVDTALGACSAAVVADGRVLAHEHQAMLRGHAEALAPLVQKLMTQAGLGFAALDRIAVTTGPGTFTGQRVGLAFARALGVALKKPVIGVTTLDVMAEEALETIPDAAWAIAAADAKRGELYFGARARGAQLIAPDLIALAAMPEHVAGFTKRGRRVALAGTAAEAILPLLVQAGFDPADSAVRQPDAIFVAKLARDCSEGPPPKPLYLRPPDARLPGAGT
jgi:tRNA threonylcarbamoyladenosine biosynthesis protein TsaB